MRRRMALRAFACGAAAGAALASAAVAEGGPAMAAVLLAASTGGLAVMILGVRIGALRRRGDELAAMLGSVRAGLVVLDRNEVCMAGGGQLRELLEMPAGWDPTGLTITELLTELADRGDFGPRVPPGQPVDAGLFRSPGFRDIYMETPGGRVLAVAVAEQPQGGWVLTYTDITEQKEQTRAAYRARRELEVSEARARQLAREAEAASAAKSTFMAAMSHEFRTPMNGIIGMCEILAETELGEEQRAHVATIRQSGESLLGIINDILDFSRIEAGRMTLDSAPFNLRAAIEDVLRLVHPTARERGLEVRLDYAAGLPEVFLGDRQRLRQVLVNLAGNAVKFTPEGHVVVRVRGEDRRPRTVLEIAVEDTGIGIAKEDLDRIFEEFARAEGAGTRRFEGTGLGLAVTKRLVELMEGDVDVESELGIGTTFTLRIALPPAAEAPPEPWAPEAWPAPPAPVERPARRPVRVLLVEDNRTNQIVVSKMLKGEPVELRIAQNGREAISLFPDVAPDLVLMDVSMPDMDGFAATAELRRLEAQLGLARTPVIALTAYAGAEDRARCLAHDMDDYLSKPLHKPALVGLIRAHGRTEEPPAASRAAAGS